MLYLEIPACACHRLTFQHDSLKGTDSEPKQAHEREDFRGRSLVCTAQDVTLVLLQSALATLLCLNQHLQKHAPLCVSPNRLWM